LAFAADGRAAQHGYPPQKRRANQDLESECHPLATSSGAQGSAICASTSRASAGAADRLLVADLEETPWETTTRQSTTSGPRTRPRRRRPRPASPARSVPSGSSVCNEPLGVCRSHRVAVAPPPHPRTRGTRPRNPSRWSDCSFGSTEGRSGSRCQGPQVARREKCRLARTGACWRSNGQSPRPRSGGVGLRELSRFACRTSRLARARGRFPRRCALVQGGVAGPGGRWPEL
jgi:hypothetical protein